MRPHLLSTGLCAVLSLAAAQLNTAANSNLERELVQRALTYQPGEQVQLLPGTLPADLPAPLPNLSGARLIGSVVRRQSPRDSTQAFYDLPQTAAAVGSVLRAQLTGAGWTVFPRPTPFNNKAGFLSSEGVQEYLSFYREDKQATLDVNVQPDGPGRTRLSLTLSREPNLATRIREARNFPDFQLDLPGLTPPPDTQIQPRGSGGGSNPSTTALIQTKLSASALLDFYAAQLKTAGWTLVSKVPQGKQITSVWSFTQDGQPRVGVLAIGGEGGSYNGLLSSLSLNE